VFRLHYNPIPSVPVAGGPGQWLARWLQGQSHARGGARGKGELRGTGGKNRGELGRTGGNWGERGTGGNWGEPWGEQGKTEGSSL